jgi:hypothetical protein
MQGISVVRIYTDTVNHIYQEAVSNISELAERIIRFFGQYALEIEFFMRSNVRNVGNMIH